MWEVRDIFSILLKNHISAGSSVLTMLLEIVHVSQPCNTTQQISFTDDFFSQHFSFIFVAIDEDHHLYFTVCDCSMM